MKLYDSILEMETERSLALEVELQSIYHVYGSLIPDSALMVAKRVEKTKKMLDAVVALQDGDRDAVLDDLIREVQTEDQDEIAQIPELAGLIADYCKAQVDFYGPLFAQPGATGKSFTEVVRGYFANHREYLAALAPIHDVARRQMEVLGNISNDHQELFEMSFHAMKTVDYRLMSHLMMGGPSLLGKKLETSAADVYRTAQIFLGKRYR